MASADQLIDLFHQARAIPAGPGRDAFLDRSCGDAPGLRDQLLSLLQAEAEHGGSDFLRSTSRIRPGALVTEKAGDRIGRYKLLQQIGEGGCGVVYMAEQEEPVRRRVALKIIKLGMDTRSVVARFEAERQALALMDHPNIAKVHDGGATETGRPFFVMELVRGTRITEYCDQNQLSTPQRLELFIQVCQAIQHAHQKGIIHRDVKPSNILVTVNDGVPVPKVIDFGIAKATEQRLTDKTVFTAFEQFIGTPAYMSPEQAEMTSLDIDTRADIYSLGVLLYELLTGNTPFDARQLLTSGVNEMRRIIRESEPPKPSTRLHTLGAEMLSTVAARRRTDPPRLLHAVRGDLDWIVMKCLEKDRVRRYETANGLAADLRRHLENEPVMARPPSRLYEFQKTVRRHRFGFAATGAVMVALAIGLGVALWQSVERTRAYDRAVLAEKAAQTEAARSREVARFLKETLQSAEPSIALGRDTLLLREILDRTAERVGRELGHQPEVEAELRSIIGNTYYELGDWTKAVAMHREALRLRRSRLGETNALVAVSLDNLGNVLRTQLHLSEAESLHREALAMRKNLFGDAHRDVAQSLASLASVLLDRGELTEAEAALREALRIQQRLPDGSDFDRADLLNALVPVLVLGTKLEEAERAGREAVRLSSQGQGEAHPTAATSLVRLCLVLERQGRFPEAEAACREAVAMRRKLLGSKHPYVASALDRLASILGKQGKVAEATGLLRECLAIREAVMPGEPQVFNARLRLGENLLAQGEPAPAEVLLVSAYHGMKEHESRLPAERRSYLTRAARALVKLYTATGPPAKAAEWAETLAELERLGDGQASPRPGP